MIGDMTTPKRTASGARAALASVRDLATRATGLLAAPAILRDSARHQIEILNEAEVGVRLREKPVTVLREVVSGGVRLGVLEQAGFRSVADVLQAPDHQLEQVPGVGPRTVQEVRRAAKEVAEQVQRDVRFRFDPDRRNAAQTRLLATLAAVRAADEAAAELRKPVHEFVKHTPLLVAEAERAGSWIGMSFWDGDHKFGDARARLERVAVSDPAADLDALTRALKSKAPMIEWAMGDRAECC